MTQQLKVVHDGGLELLRALTALRVESANVYEPYRLQSLNRGVIRAAVALERAVNPRRLTAEWYLLHKALDPSYLSGVEGLVRWLANWSERWFKGAEFFGNDGPAPTGSVLTDGLCNASPDDLHDFRRSLDALRSFLQVGMAEGPFAGRQTRLAVDLEASPPHIVLDGKPYPAPEVAVRYLGALLEADGARVSFAEWVKSYPQFEGEVVTRVLRNKISPCVRPYIDSHKGCPPRLKVEALGAQ
jgi:hypothetical protein